MQKFQNLIVLGSGLAAEVFLFTLLEQFSEDQRKGKSRKTPLFLQQISSSLLAPHCSSNSTSLCALRGAKLNSPLGSALSHGFSATQAFVEKWNPQGVVKGMLMNCCDENSEFQDDFVRRFGPKIERVHSLPLENFSGATSSLSLKAPMLLFQEEALFFDLPIFLHWLREKQKAFLAELPGVFLERVEGFVEEISLYDQEIFLHGKFQNSLNQTWKSRNVLACTGAYTKLFQGLFPSHPKIEESKIVAGSFWECSQVDWGKKTFGFNFHEQNLLYRAHTHTLVLGGSADEGAQIAPSIFQLQQTHEKFSNSLPSAFALPPFEAGAIKTGLRHKGVRRLPFWGEIYKEKKAGLYGIFSFYKSGLGYAFMAASEVAAQIKDF